MEEILGGQNMFQTEQITRRCLMTLSDGSKTQATITIPQANQAIFPEQMERRLIEKFNNQQPHMANKVVKLHIMRN